MRYATFFPDLPDEARLWIHAADRSLHPDEQRRLMETLDDFLTGWTSHGRRVEGAARFVADRFLLVAAQIPGGDVSGCGIDALVRRLEEMARQMDFAWASPLSVFYRDAEGQPRRASRADFARQAEAGAVTTETPVFDLSLTSVGALRAGRFEKPAGQAWHARAFSLPEPAA